MEGQAESEFYLMEQHLLRDINRGTLPYAKDGEQKLRDYRAAIERQVRYQICAEIDANIGKLVYAIDVMDFIHPDKEPETT